MTEHWWGTEDGNRWFGPGHVDASVARECVLTLERECNGTLDPDIEQDIREATVSHFWLIPCEYDREVNGEEHRYHVVAEGTKGAEPYTEVLA